MDDPASSFESAWSSFQARDALRLAADSWEWSHGRAQYLTFLVRVEQPAAREHLAGVVDRLAGIPGIEPYPDWYWHVTVKGIGFQVVKRVHPDDVLRQDARRTAEQAQAVFSREEAFEAHLGPANAFADAVFVEVWDGGRLRRLNARLVEALPELHRYPSDGGVYLPHVSVGYFTSNEGLVELKAALAALRSEGPGPMLPVRRIELVRAWLLSEDVPELDVLATYALRPPR